MEVKELRIGNYLSLSDSNTIGYLCSVYRVGYELEYVIELDSQNEYVIEELEPIPLTEEELTIK